MLVLIALGFVAIVSLSVLGLIAFTVARWTHKKTGLACFSLSFWKNGVSLSEYLEQ